MHSGLDISLLMILCSLHSSIGAIVSIIYVDDVITPGDDTNCITDLKCHLGKQFHNKDLGALRFFLGIKVAHCSRGISHSQGKYVLDLATETDPLIPL